MTGLGTPGWGGAWPSGFAEVYPKDISSSVKVFYWLRLYSEYSISFPSIYTFPTLSVLKIQTGQSSIAKAGALSFDGWKWCQWRSLFLINHPYDNCCSDLAQRSLTQRSLERDAMILESPLAASHTDILGSRL